MMRELIAGKRSNYQIEKCYIHKSGKQLHGTLNVSLLSDPEDNKQFLYVQVIDSTEKYLISDSLIKSEKKYRLLAEPLPIHLAFVQNLIGL
ncbi:hypothetical protein AS29_005980 [Bacillus sp. SJS]|nr:hypothetical protein AS29_005980 [Bacillus sp. SJS]